MTQGEGPEGLPHDETEVDASLTPTKARTDPKEAADAEREVDSDVGLSGAVEKGAGALANVGKRRGSDLFRE